MFFRNFDGGKDRMEVNMKMLGIKKKRHEKLFLFSLLLVFAVWIFSGCVTPSVPVKYTEPARLDMSDISRIAIDSDNAQATNEISRRLTATGKYTIAGADELQAWKQWNEFAAYQAPATEVKSANLVEAYLANAVRADASYSGKMLKTSGAVKEIGVTSGGRYFVRLEVGKNAVDVFFAPSQLDKVASINKGNTITVVGQCVGFKLPEMNDTAEILRILGAGQSVYIINAIFPVGDYPGKVDAVISLRTKANIQTATRSVKESVYVGKDADGKAIYQEQMVTYYDRQGSLDINYQIVRTRGGSNIGQGTKSAKSSVYSNKDPSYLPSASDIASKIIDKPLLELAGEMVPTERTVSVTLAKEENNKEAKKEMSEAEKLVKAKDYKAAAESYGKIYARYNNFAAGYNQAVLTEGTEGTVAAIVLMEALAKQTNENLAKTTLAEMQSRNKANQQAAQQLSK